MSDVRGTAVKESRFDDDVAACVAPDAVGCAGADINGATEVAEAGG